ncbi:hypothetical protein KIN20_013402 [Parelaphostrongylus tenuis]|uniref:Uncharacterized protein n=1 Tax=Parelaphostrongylus tenuis TaxID=148309 RepID=A0AAD5MC17_PARTN|nr:hypothetical protein KIN20_013402 [Parelaphostrongylus tenuis]
MVRFCNSYCLRSSQRISNATLYTKDVKRRRVVDGRNAGKYPRIRNALRVGLELCAKKVWKKQCSPLHMVSSHPLNSNPFANRLLL